MAWCFTVPLTEPAGFGEAAELALNAYEDELAAHPRGGPMLEELSTGMADDAIKAAVMLAEGSALGTGSVTATLSGHRGFDDSAPSSVNVTVVCRP